MLIPLLFSIAGSVTAVSSPSVESANTNYVSFRAPLQQVPFVKLPIGAVKPKGWLYKYLLLQRDGLNGQLGTISDWLDKEGNQWLSGTGDHGWEEVPYWLRGYISLAYLLDDAAMKAEAETWISAVLRGQRSDGMLGPDGYDGESPDLWAKMPMLWALQTYYEATGDTQVLSAMTRYFQWEQTIPDEHFLKGYWQEKRGGDNLWSLLWLYNQTGNTTLLPLADKLHAATANWTLKDTLPNWHGVNIAQGFREPAIYYLYKGDPTLLHATYANHHEMRRRYGQMPGGMFAADENAREGYTDPRNGAETCAMVEQMASDEILMSITGDPFWADHCENVAFNSFTAALAPDMRSLRYITSANMTISDEKRHGPSIDNDLRGMLSMSPFSSRCCQHNHGMGWPYYAQHLVMATSENGLAAMLYAASETTAEVANHKTVTLIEDTHYPFDEDVTFTIRCKGKVEFPLYLRIPSWTEGASVTLNGEKPVAINTAEQYVRLQRKWKDGDTVRLHLPMTMTTTLWEQHPGSVSVNYGPFSLSLKMDEKWEAHDSRDHAFVQDDSHWQQGVDASLWPSYVLTTDSPWNYALCLGNGNLPMNFNVEHRPYPDNDQPFTLDNVPLVFKALGRQVPSWGFDATGMTNVLPAPDAPRSLTADPITLIPMGAARLRISVFPTAQ